MSGSRIILINEIACLSFARFHLVNAVAGHQIFRRGLAAVPLLNVEVNFAANYDEISAQTFSSKNEKKANDED